MRSIFCASPGRRKLHKNCLMSERTGQREEAQIRRLLRHVSEWRSARVLTVTPEPGSDLKTRAAPQTPWESAGASPPWNIRLRFITHTNTHGQNWCVCLVCVSPLSQKVSNGSLIQSFLFIQKLCHSVWFPFQNFVVNQILDSLKHRRLSVWDTDRDKTRCIWPVAHLSLSDRPYKFLHS